MAVKEIKIIKKKCPRCPRILKALSEVQMKFNMESHLEKHKREEQGQ